MISRVLAGQLIVVAMVATACEHDRPDPPRDPPRERRFIEPPVGIVRALPPFAIRADGVGPYRLGDKLTDILKQLPSPRMPLFEIPGLLHHNMIRAEDDHVLIGGEPFGTATFIAVIDPVVAQTESGLHVAAPRAEAELERTAGPVVADPDLAMDPRLLVPTSPRNARLIIEDGRIDAIVVVADGALPRASPPPSSLAPCPRPPSTAKRFGACLTGAGELVELVDNEFAIRAAETDRTIAAFKVPATVVFAAPLRTAEGRDELVIVTRADSEQQRTWTLLAYRFDSGKIAQSVQPSTLYTVSASNARWIGAELREIELYLELASRGESIEVGGLLTTHTGERPQDVVVISPVSIARRHGKSAPSEGSAAGSADPATGVGSGSGSGSGAKPAKP